MRRLIKMADEMETVGDSSRNILQNIQASARELMRIAVQCSINARSVKECKSSEELPLLVVLKRLKKNVHACYTSVLYMQEISNRMDASPVWVIIRVTGINCEALANLQMIM